MPRVAPPLFFHNRPGIPFPLPISPPGHSVQEGKNEGGEIPQRDEEADKLLP